MKFYFLGTCSGTEPMPGTHHSSFILESGGVNYWFEAGENCAHRAREMGIDVMNTVALFVSHGHIDHVGGLANLLFTLSKRAARYKETLVRENTLRLFFPHEPALLEAIKTIAGQGRKNPSRFTLEEHTISDGVLFEDENLRVSALHNTHLKEDGSSGWHAFSFLIECEGKRIVFSGDVRSPDELLPLMAEGCDLFLMETGHHKVEDVLAFATKHAVPRLLLTHHGRQILEKPEEMARLCSECSAKHPISVRILRDGDTQLL